MYTLLSNYNIKYIGRYIGVKYFSIFYNIIHHFIVYYNGIYIIYFIREYGTRIGFDFYIHFMFTFIR